VSAKEALSNKKLNFKVDKAAKLEFVFGSKRMQYIRRNHSQNLKIKGIL
jgi:hypothetical protein